MGSPTRDYGRDENGNKIEPVAVSDSQLKRAGEEQGVRFADSSNAALNVDKTVYAEFKKFCAERGWLTKFMGNKALQDWMEKIRKMETDVT